VQSLDTSKQCPECGSLRVVEDLNTGEVFCGECGLVIEDVILDQSPEWRAFTVEERLSKRRVGAPTIYSQSDKGLSTIIKGNRDAFGRPLSPEVKRQMWRLRRWHIRYQRHSSISRNLTQAMDVLQRLSEKLHISPSVQETAAVIYRKALKKDLIKGRSIAAIVAASLYAACRLTKTPRTLREIVEASLRDRDEVARSYRLLLRRLEIKVPFQTPIEYVAKIAEKAGVSGEVQGLAVSIIREAEQRRITVGKDPTGVAATALYIACQLKKKKTTQEEIAKAANITEVTIRNRKRELEKKLDLKKLVAYGEKVERILALGVRLVTDKDEIQV